MSETEEEEFEGAENAERAKEKADARPARNSKKANQDGRSIDRSKASKEAAQAKVEQGRKRPGRP